MIARPLNPIELEIRWSRLISMMDEVDAAVVRTAFSSIVGESRDFGVLLMNRLGESLAQSQLSTPAFMITLPITCKHLLKAVPEHELEPGDVLITNDPWLGSGHLPDLSICTPVFHQGRVLGFVGCVAHISDIGGRSDYLDDKEIFEEGLRIPPTRLMRKGEPVQAVFDIIAANVRVPHLVIGDIYAILGAEWLGAQRLMAFLDDYGEDALDELSSEILTRSDVAMRSAIRKHVSNGVYRGSIESDGHNEPIRVAVEITVNDGAVTVDFEGSSQERLDSSINSVMNCTFSDTFYPFKSSFIPDLPNNEGATRFLTVRAPEGSILNTRFPRAVRARSKTSSQIHMAVYDALSEAMPDRTHAGSGSFWTLSASGIDNDGEPYRAHMLPNGGKGAVHNADGLPTIAFPYNGTITPVEVFENLAPVLVGRRELLADSGGVGRHRGGLGQRLAFTSMSKNPMKFFVRPDKVRHPPPGVLGGEAGRPGRLLRNGVETKSTLMDLEKGETVEIHLPGGGGFGPATERGSELKRRDREAGYTGPQQSMQETPTTGEEQ